MNIDSLKGWLSVTMANLPHAAGAIFGIPASRFVEADEDGPVLRIAADGIVREIECDLAEEDEIVRKTEPVDYARCPHGRSTVFIWYRKPGEYPELFRQHRLQSGNKTLQDLQAEYQRDAGFLKPIPKPKR